MASAHGGANLQALIGEGRTNVHEPAFELHTQGTMPADDTLAVPRDLAHAQLASSIDRVWGRRARELVDRTSTHVVQVRLGAGVQSPRNFSAGTGTGRSSCRTNLIGGHRDGTVMGGAAGAHFPVRHRRTLMAACRGMDTAIFYHPQNERGPTRHRRDWEAKWICQAVGGRTCRLQWALETRAVRRLGRNVGWRSGNGHGVRAAPGCSVHAGVSRLVV